jgi:hypothetical protein
LGVLKRAGGTVVRRWPRWGFVGVCFWACCRGSGRGVVVLVMAAGMVMLVDMLAVMFVAMLPVMLVAILVLV